MSINQLKIGQRLSLAFASVLVLLVALSALAWRGLEASRAATDSVVVMEKRSAATDEWVGHTRLNATRVIALAKSNNNTDVDSYFKPLITQTSARISELQKMLDAEITSEKGKALLVEISGRRKAYIDIRNKFFTTLLSGDSFEADRALESDLLCEHLQFSGVFVADRQPERSVIGEDAMHPAITIVNRHGKIDET